MPSPQVADPDGRGRAPTAKVFDSIRDVPREDWNGLLKAHSRTYSIEFWEVVEQAKLEGFSFRHVLFYDSAGRAVGLASVYVVTTDIAIFASSWLRGALSALRGVFPRLLKFRMLECGTPVTLNAPFVAGDAIRDDAGACRALIDALNATLSRIAREQRCFLVVLRDFEARHATLERTLRTLGYHLVDSLPTTYLEIAWRTPEEYLAAMKSYYRSKLLKHLRVNRAQGIRHELRDAFDELAEELCAQWRVVHEHADEYHREVLTPAFYRGLSRGMGGDAKVLLFFREGVLVGHALLLVDGDLLRWLYFGRSRSVNDSLYIYAGHQVVETAIRLGARRLELGLTTYAIKRDLGASMSPIRLALRAPRRLINPFVGVFYPLLNHAPQVINKNIFKARRPLS